MEEKYIKGRGAQINTQNPFSSRHFVREHIEGIDFDEREDKTHTQFFQENAKKIVNKVDSPDLNMYYSLNPYQGCEHGCAYCYARNTHQYWGYSAGLDFESKIIIKKNAPELLEKRFQTGNWQPVPIAVSGNTDCYQPAERKFQITRKLLQVFLKYGHPLGMITKNSLILRDLDILQELAAKRLVRVMISVTSLDERLRRAMEPRTASAASRLKTIEELSRHNIPVGVMTAPIIPGLNNYEIPGIIAAVADAGALTAGYTVVRLNGAVKDLFYDWLYKTSPDRADKVWNQVCELHGGKVNDTEWGRRIKGDGPIAAAINQIFKATVKKHLGGRSFPPYDLTQFSSNGSLRLF